MNIANMTKRQIGDLSKLRELLDHVDACLLLTGDESLFQTVEQGTIDVIQNDMIHARYATSNSLCELGDSSAVTKEMPRQVRRR